MFWEIITAYSANTWNAHKQHVRVLGEGGLQEYFNITANGVYSNHCSFEGNVREMLFSN